MKKILAILLAAMMVFALAACDTGDGPNPSGSNNPGTSQGGENNNGGAENNDGAENNGGTENNGGSSSQEDCAFCFDIEGGDRKCDDCGKWVYPDGEVWTQEVPANLRVVVSDDKFYYAVEKIGEEFYIQMWSNKTSMDNGETPNEDFVRLNKRFGRYRDNANQPEWTENVYQTEYADVYELFAVNVLQSLSGTTISSMVEKCKDVASSGTETIAGKDCVVKEYDGLFGTKYKVWFWNNMPLKQMYKDQSMDDYEVLFEIHEWDDTITAFSTNVPA